MPGDSPVSLGHLAAIVSSSDDAIISKDLTGRVLTWNRAAERLFGYTAEEAVGRHISLIIPEDRLAEEDFVIGRIRAGTGVDHYETIRRRKDGSFVEISLTVSPIHDLDGKIIGASKIARDISEQKQLQRMAEEAHRAKDQFLATLSHELRTPLNTVLGYVQMLQSGSLPPDQLPKALEVISRNASALRRLVDDVLDVSRVITGKMWVELRPCDLTPLIEQAVASIRPTAENKSLTVRTDVEEGLTVNCDADRLGQILWNLLSNAVKFTPAGGSVSVSARAHNRTVRIAVEDTGAGIPAADLPFVFQRFWQGASVLPNNQNSLGLGLGLALAKHLVELHGGEISVQSAGPGLGARFEIELPAPR
ncbi:MAG TPA: PAS domain-containing sensor histidine kinase [Vicinamibacterales bacterium]|nr:PAS domain-containing sensor histidine kinase [Vicinamibacterales bacterium]